jgi:hypothetical protein
MNHLESLRKREDLLDGSHAEEPAHPRRPDREADRPEEEDENRAKGCHGKASRNANKTHQELDSRQAGRGALGVHRAEFEGRPAQLASRGGGVVAPVQPPVEALLVHVLDRARALAWVHQDGDVAAAAAYPALVLLLVRYFLLHRIRRPFCYSSSLARPAQMRRRGGARCPQENRPLSTNDDVC